jgi:hypothetical protein
MGVRGEAAAGDGTGYREVNMTAPAKETEHEEITVLLVSKVVDDLQRTQKRTDLSKTDIVNRAITLYDFLDGEQDSGAELLLRRRDGSTHLVELV